MKKLINKILKRKYDTEKVAKACALELGKMIRNIDKLGKKTSHSICIHGIDNVLFEVNKHKPKE